MSRHILARLEESIVLLPPNWKELQHFRSFSTTIQGFLLLVAILHCKLLWLYSEPSKQKCSGRRILSFLNFFRNSNDTVFRSPIK